MSDEIESFKQPRGLRIATTLFLVIWTIIAVFPFLWIALMSIKSPVDAFSANPLRVIVGPATAAAGGGVSPLALFVLAGLGYAGFRLWRRRGAELVSRAMGDGDDKLRGGLLITAAIFAGLATLALLPWALSALSGLGSALHLPAILIDPVIGATGQHYRTVWITDGFHKQFVNSMVITLGVVTVSLTLGTPAAYAFARTPSRLALGLLVVALIFRSMPHSVLVAGYLPAFINSREFLTPLWTSPTWGPFFHLFSDAAPTLYGKPWAVIAVLVAINQPFTIWLLRSFFLSVPKDLDEAAKVDGCSDFGAFRRIIMPVMWPGVITTGLFSFLLAYNDYLVTALLLDAASQTMVPTISQYINSENNLTDQLRAIAAAVSVTAPLFLLVLVFQRQLVSGMTAGAVKG